MCGGSRRRELITFPSARSRIPRGRSICPWNSRMSKVSDRLIATELREALGNEILVVEETESTNDLVWKAFERGAGEGFVVFAERQTKGRGQYGRRWESAPNLGLWFSILLRPAVSLRDSAKLTPRLAETVAATIAAETGCSPTIKLPNDIYISGRKVAGVLVDR